MVPSRFLLVLVVSFAHCQVVLAESAGYLAELVQRCEIDWPKNETINIVCHGHSVPAGYFKTPVIRVIRGSI